LDGEFVVVAGGETEHEKVHGGGSQLAEIMEVTTGKPTGHAGMRVTRLFDIIR
jgi:hypothetical protein